MTTELPEQPLSRKESYLAKIAGEDVELPESPESRTEQYLAYIAENGGGGGGGEAKWGDITGTLSNQTDLNDALSAKYTKPTTGIPETDLANGVQQKLNRGGSGLRQLEELPLTAEEGEIVEYVGETNADYVNGKVYQYKEPKPNRIENLVVDETAPEGQEQLAGVNVDVAAFEDYVLPAFVELTYAPSGDTWTGHVVTSEIDSVVRGVDIANFGVTLVFNEGYNTLTDPTVISFNYELEVSGGWLRKDVGSQYPSIPSNPQVGEIIQYVGETNDTYYNGMFYEYIQGSPATIEDVRWTEESDMGNNQISDITIDVDTFSSLVFASDSYSFVFDGSMWTFSGSMIRDINPEDYGVTITLRPGVTTLTNSVTITLNYTAAVSTGWYPKDVQPIQLDVLPANNEKLEGRIVQYTGKIDDDMRSYYKTGHFYKCVFAMIAYAYEEDPTVNADTRGTYYTKRGLRYIEVVLDGTNYQEGVTYYKRTSRKMFNWEEVQIVDTFQYSMMPADPTVGQVIQFTGYDMDGVYDHCGIYEYVESDQPHITTSFESSYIIEVNPIPEEFILWAGIDGPYTFTAFNNASDENKLYWRTQKYNRESGEWETVEILWSEVGFLGIEAPDLSQIPAGDTITVDLGYRFEPGWKKTINNSQVKVLESIYPDGIDLWGQTSGLYKVTGFIRLMPETDLIYVKDEFFYVLNDMDNEIHQYWRLTNTGDSVVTKYYFQFHYDDVTGDLVYDERLVTDVATEASVQTAISGKEDVSNKVTMIDSSATDIEYPSAKSVFDYVTNITVEEKWYDTNLAANITWDGGGCYDRNGVIQPTANYIYSTIGIPVSEGQTYKIVNYTEDQSVYELTSRVGMLTFGDTIDSSTIKGFVVRLSASTEVYPSVVGSEWTPEYVVFTVPVGAGITKLWLNVYAPQGGTSYATNVAVYQRQPSYIIPINDRTNLVGKKWTSFGDSITYRNTWQPYLISRYGLVHTNCGIGSTCLAGTGANAFWQDVRLDAVKASDPDFITILGGANDLGDSNITIGTSAEFEKTLANKDKNTFIGAYSYIIENLLTWKPSLKIIILGTTWAHNNGADYSQTLTYTDFSNACKEVAQYYGLEFVDLHGTCGFNKFTMGDSPYNVYSSDHIHPNDAGSKIIADRVDKVFETMDLF